MVPALLTGILTARAQTVVPKKTPAPANGPVSGKVAVVPADQWPDFRGPSGDGISRAAGVPLKWSETENVKWKTAIHGQAWSSPVVWGNQVWVTTATPEGDTMSALCVDRATGRVLLDRPIFTNAEVEERSPGHESNTYASPSPVIEEGRVYLHFGRYGTACLDARTFKTLWERRDILCTHAVGPASSPVLFRDRLILTFDGIDTQFLTALDTRTGKSIWKTDRTVDWKAFDSPGRAPDVQQRKAFSTPLIAWFGGKPLLVSSGAKAACGYDPVTGAELWKVTYKGFSNAARPIAGPELVYINSGYPRAELLAVRPGGRGDVTGTHIAWQMTKNVPLNPSPLLLDGLLYLISGGGILTCVDAKTGAEVWQERLDGPFSASPIFIDGRIFLFNERGTGVVLEPGRQFKRVGENELEDGLMGSPAAAGRSLILRTKTHLYCVEAAATKPNSSRN